MSKPYNPKDFECFDSVPVTAFDNCCSVLKCPAGYKEKMKIPLERNFSDVFGTLDKVQLELIASKSLPVVLIENASDFVRILKNNKGFIEAVVDLVIKDVYDITGVEYDFLGSYNIDHIVKQEYLEKYPMQVQGLEKADNNYDRIISRIRNRLEQSRGENILIHLGINLEDGGHYGVIIKRGDDILVFDSMQAEIPEYSGYFSAYTGFFTQVSDEVFDTKNTRVFDSKSKTSLQYTGGFFSETKPPRTASRYQKMRYRIKSQNMDSQNHFCYMWSIWFFHLFATEGEEDMHNIMIFQGHPHPLNIIKRYIWAIVNIVYNSDAKLNQAIKEAVMEQLLENTDDVVDVEDGGILYTKNGVEKELTKKDIDFFRAFFLYHFRYIWDSCGTTLFHRFSIIDCKKRRFTGIHEALLFSLQKVVYVFNSEDLEVKPKKSRKIKPVIAEEKEWKSILRPRERKVYGK